MRVAINAVSARRGGAVTYLQNMLPVLRRSLEGEADSRIVVWRGEASTGSESWPSGIEYREDITPSAVGRAVGSTFRRLWFDQVQIPRTLRREDFDVLFSSANFGPLRSPRRHVLLVRNPIYFDPTFMSRMAAPRVRAYYLAQRWLTMRCIESADVVFFPTQGMLDLVSTHTGGARANWRVAHYGTRPDIFHPSSTEVATPTDDQRVELLNVSLYCDQKNFGTLLRAVDTLEQREPKRYRLRLTAGFGQDWLASSAYFPNFSSERAMFQRLARVDAAVDVDWKRYGSLPDLYRSARIFVFPSYTESFGHPLVEAMASGLPIVAADVPVNRELCRDAAVYFPAFDVGACAEAIRRVAEDGTLAARLSSVGLARAREFTWERHVGALVTGMSAS